MAKYSYEFKLKVVQAYLNGKGSYVYLAKQYNISSDEQVHNWVKEWQSRPLDEVYAVVFMDAISLPCKIRGTYSKESGVHSVRYKP